MAAPHASTPTRHSREGGNPASASGPFDRHSREGGNPVFSFWRIAPFALLTLLFIAEIVAILACCDGHFFYTLDDPYIHLAVSQNIAHGSYDLNAGEPSSPSSSILFPFLLALAAPFSFHEFAPLVINLLAMLAALALLLRLLDRAGLTSADRPLRRVLLALVLALYLNIFGVAFTGMEHSLQFALALAVALGLLVFLEEDRLPRWLIAALIVGPLVRFEALSLSLAALALIAPKRPAAALATFAGMALPLAAFAWFLHGLGLPWLPASVLVKLEAPAGLAGVVAKLALAFHRAKALGLLFAAILASQARARFRTPVNRRLIIFAAAIAAAHVLFGAYGSLFRYEGYLFLTLAAIAANIYREPLVRFTRRPLLVDAGATLALLATPLGYFVNFPPVANPLAARNIYRQQFQMHRFATEFLRAPVAVNDLGRVAYQNPRYVLDLFGLASEEARLARQTNNPQLLAALADRKGVTVAMVYRAWFTRLVPPEWAPVARLRLAGKKVSAAEAEVSFYAIRPTELASIAAVLEAFRAALPAGATLDIGPFSP